MFFEIIANAAIRKMFLGHSKRESMKGKIVIAGGTGFIGTYLEKRFCAEGYEAIIISRDKDHINWDNEGSLIEALNGAELLINLAGKSVDCRYNKRTGVLS